MNAAALLVMQAAGGGLGGMLMLFLPMIVIMYFLIYLPQQRQKKKMQEMHAGLKNGDKIMTTSGIYGTINGLDGNTVILKVADNVKIRVAREAVGTILEASDDAK